MKIGYALPEAADVSLSVYDVTGRLITDLIKDRLSAGIHTAIFNGTDLANGVYIIRLETCGEKSLIKVALLK